MGDGGYAPIAEALFNRCDVDAFLLEYDSARAGDFAPLRHLPAGKRVYLGIISTKNPELESVGRSNARLDDASRLRRWTASASARNAAFPARRCRNSRYSRASLQPTFRRLKSSGWSRSDSRPGGTFERGSPILDSYGLFTAEAVQDPYPYYRRCANSEPVHWSEKAQAWYFTRYEDVFELQDRPDLSVDRIETIYSYLPRTNPERFSDIVDHYNRWLLYRDDAYHDRLKALFLKAMTPRAVERLRPMIQRRVDDLLNSLEGRDAFDAYLDFAARIPTQVMLDLLGLPDSDER